MGLLLRVLLPLSLGGCLGLGLCDAALVTLRWQASFASLGEAVIYILGSTLLALALVRGHRRRARRRIARWAITTIPR